jgi:glutamate carboxypeptidase
VPTTGHSHLLADLLAWCRSQQPWVREVIEALVRLESPSTDSAAAERCGAVLAERLRALGATVERLDGGRRARHIRADVAGSPRRVLLLGHFDTVWPVGQLERMPLREEGGRLYGPGVFDMKAGIGVAMLAVRALQERHLPDAPHVTML